MNDVPVVLEKSRAGVVEPAARLLKPIGVREVGAREEVYALDLRVPREIIEIELPAGSVGVPRVDMKVGSVAHAEIVPHVASQPDSRGTGSVKECV